MVTCSDSARERRGKSRVFREGKEWIWKIELVSSREGKESIVKFDVAGGPLNLPTWDRLILDDTDTRDDIVRDLNRLSLCGGRFIDRTPLIRIGPGIMSGSETLEP